MFFLRVLNPQQHWALQRPPQWQSAPQAAAFNVPPFNLANSSQFQAPAHPFQQGTAAASGTSFAFPPAASSSSAGGAAASFAPFPAAGAAGQMQFSQTAFSQTAGFPTSFQPQAPTVPVFGQPIASVPIVPSMPSAVPTVPSAPAAMPTQTMPYAFLPPAAPAMPTSSLAFGPYGSFFALAFVSALALCFDFNS